MQSSNPIFTRSEGFNGRGGAQESSPATWSTGLSTATGTPGGPVTHTQPGVDQGPMTIDTVVQKTALTLGVVVVTAALTWVLTGEINDPQAASTFYALSLVGALGGFALAMVNSFKRMISPALVLAYAAFEGVFVGAFSKAIESIFNNGGTPGGLVIGAVVGTMAAVAGTLAAYRFFHIKVGQRFRTWVIAAMFGFVAVSLLDMVMGFFGASFGFNGFGGLGFFASLLGLGLGVLMLILDFDFVERGIAAGLPERESWRAAFGLTVTIIWIYVELLRLLAILRGN